MSEYIPTTKRQHNLGLTGSPNTLSVYFHLNNILKIKKSLGEECTYISHLEYPQHELKEVKKGMFKRVKVDSKYGIIAKFKNHNPILATLNGTPSDIKAEYYTQLKNDLNGEARKRGII